MGKKYKKRRPYERKENPRKIFREMTRDHVDVLQNIEFCIVSAAREDRKIDDRAVASALKATIAETMPTNEIAAKLTGELENARLLRSDVDESIWKNGLKVVLESVHTHSNAQPGDYDYLSFISDYVI
jgi:hypothetical protein